MKIYCYTKCLSRNIAKCVPNIIFYWIWFQNLQDLVEFTEYLIEIGFRFVLKIVFRTLSQCALEHVFGLCRQMSGSNYYKRTGIKRVMDSYKEKSRFFKSKTFTNPVVRSWFFKVWRSRLSMWWWFPHVIIVESEMKNQELKNQKYK